MNLKEQTLLIPEKTDTERDEVAEKWIAMNGRVMRLGHDELHRLYIMQDTDTEQMILLNQHRDPEWLLK